MDVLLHLYWGFECYFARPDAMAGTLTQSILWARPTLFFAVPRIWEKFELALKDMKLIKNSPLSKQTEIEVLGLDKCVDFMYGAAPLKQSSVQFFNDLKAPLFNIYGMSETCGAHVLHATHRYKLDSAGFTLPGCDTMIYQPDLEQQGEVCMRGRNIMMGYLDNEKATCETIDSQGFLHSGDLGKIDQDGFLSITGRIKELIITAGGENIAPVKVEDTFKIECPPCSNIMVVGE